MLYMERGKWGKFLKAIFFKMKLFKYKRSGAFVYVNTENALHKQVQMLILLILWLVIKERFVLTLVFI